MKGIILARRAALAVGCALLLWLAMGVQAQAAWAVYLLDTGAQALVRVSSDGAQTTLPLGLAPGEYVSAYDMSFSPDGTRVALCPVNYGDGSAAPTAALLVRDLAAQTDLLRQELGPALGCRATWRADGAFLALGIVHYLPESGVVMEGVPAWELRVVDPGSGNAIATLRADGPEAAAAGLANVQTLLPAVRRFDGAELIFAAVPFAAGGPGAVPAFSWRPGGEFAWAATDPARPAGQPPGPLPAHNIAVVRDAAGQRTVFTTPDWLIIGAAFVDDGQRLALQLVAPFNEAASETATPTRWVSVDRGGAVTELTSAAGYAQLAGAPGGYIVLQAFTPEGGGAPTYTLDYNAGGQIRTLWAAPNSATAYDLAYAPPMPPAAGLPPFAGLP